MALVPTETRTPQHQLADILLGADGPLEAFVRSRRTAGKPWRRIERDLLDATDRKVDVTYETLRSWFPDAAPSESGGTE